MLLKKFTSQLYLIYIYREVKNKRGMDAESQRLERQRALEEKRLKLEKLKREREERSRTQVQEQQGDNRLASGTEPKVS